MTDTEAFYSLLEYVETELSFATSHYNDSYLNRRISSRMRRTQTESYDAYLERIKADRDEQTALLDSMSINVTGFFRNPDVWSEIRMVLRSLAATNDSVHIWSAACADGREPYSLSMLAHDDPHIDARKIHILGTDISEDALETARNGVYNESRTVNISDQLEFLKDYTDYIDHSDDTYTVRPAVKRNVTFERHDLINGDPKSGFDLVICRNLFIYIDNEYKQSMLKTIANSLQPDGYLVIGKAETIPPQIKSAFNIHDARLRIYQLDA